MKELETVITTIKNGAVSHIVLTEIETEPSVSSLGDLATLWWWCDMPRRMEMDEDNRDLIVCVKIDLGILKW